MAHGTRVALLAWHTAAACAVTHPRVLRMLITSCRGEHRTGAPWVLQDSAGCRIGRRKVSVELVNPQLARNRRGHFRWTSQRNHTSMSSRGASPLLPWRIQTIDTSHCHPSTQEDEAGRNGVEASLGYTVKTFLKIRQKSDFSCGMPPNTSVG